MCSSVDFCCYLYLNIIASHPPGKKLEGKSIYVGQKAVYGHIIVGKSTQELEAAGYIHSRKQRKNECMQGSHTTISTLTQSRILSDGNGPTHSGLSLPTSNIAINKPFTVMPQGNLILTVLQWDCLARWVQIIRLTIKINNYYSWSFQILTYYFYCFKELSFIYLYNYTILLV